VVQIVGRRRRSWRGWLLLIGLVALNEARGLAVVHQLIKAWFS
jgi:hypothetical protein